MERQRSPATPLWNQSLAGRRGQPVVQRPSERLRDTQKKIGFNALQLVAAAWPERNRGGRRREGKGEQEAQCKSRDRCDPKRRGSPASPALACPRGCRRLPEQSSLGPAPWLQHARPASLRPAWLFRGPSRNGQGKYHIDAARGARCRGLGDKTNECNEHRLGSTALREGSQSHKSHRLLKDLQTQPWDDEGKSLGHG